MKTEAELKQLVKSKYAEIALQSKEQNETSCCGASCGCTADTAVMAEDYAHLPGYAAGADLGLGCGLPTEYAHLKAGDTVLDLGSGAGNDCFVARSIVGETGRVIGVDMTEVMIEKAKRNAAKLGFDNVDFRLGEIEDLPLASNRVDVVVSNCVLNLVPNKAKAFAETYRVLKPGGHFSISDIVLSGQLPEGLQQDAALYAGCVSGAIGLEDYLDIVGKAGFVNVRVQKQRRITLPDDLLRQYLSPEDMECFKESGTGISSVTVYAEKPGTDCCTPGSGCC
jgi:SAM-dependent methyltransferase